MRNEMEEELDMEENSGSSLTLPKKLPLKLVASQTCLSFPGLDMEESSKFECLSFLTLPGFSSSSSSLYSSSSSNRK